MSDVGKKFVYECCKCHGCDVREAKPFPDIQVCACDYTMRRTDKPITGQYRPMRGKR